MKKLFQIECPRFITTCLLLPLSILCGCNLNQQNSPAGYDLGKGEKRELGKSLNEISGINYNADDSTLLAISDSKKKIYEIRLGKLKLRDFTPDIIGPDQDLEDLVKVDSVVYLLSSKGQIYAVPQTARDSAAIQSYLLSEAKGNDFETIYYDSTAGGLIIVCKSCVFEKGQHTRTAFRFDLATRKFDSTAFYKFETDDIKNFLKNSDAKFDPSAAAIHPISKKLYVLSSAGNLLVIADLRGKVLEVYNLNPDRFPQAEGIAFAPNGDLYISNEGKFGKASLRIFKYQNGNKN